MAEYIMIGRQAWGSGETKYKAIRNITPHLPLKRLDDEISIQVVVIPDGVDWEMNMFSVQAEEIENEYEMVFEKGDLEKIKEISSRLEMAAEDALVNSERIEDGE